MLKIYPLNINSNFFRNKRNLSRYSIPVSTIPIVAYLTDKKNAEIRTTKIVKEVKNTHSHPVTDRTDFNIEQLKKAGVKDSDINKYLKSDGYINEKGKELLKEKKIPFKGTEDFIQNDKVEVSELTAEELAEIDNIDESLPPDLAEFLATPVEPAGEGLIDNIMDLDDSELGADDNFFSMVKNFLADSADWF